MTLHIAYDDRLLGWKLGQGHPTDPIRAKLATDLLVKRVGAVVTPISGLASRDALVSIHDAGYVDLLVDGFNGEWDGQRKDLGRVARLMFQGTADLVEEMVRGNVRYGFSPQGAKHHAQWDHGSGFCTLNDFAWAAQRFASAGARVAYFDTDAHHGDGVENLTRANPNVLTISIHDSAIFPGTGREHDRANRVFNYALPAESGDRELLHAVIEAKKELERFAPDVLLFAVGGDGFADDPLSTLQYSYTGYRTVARSIGLFAGTLGLPILFGGAGGYLPRTHTPRVWATVVEETYRMAENACTRS